MQAYELLEKAECSAMARLKWIILQRLGVCPLSFCAMLLSRKKVLQIAAQLVLDDSPTQKEGNPCFDMARFRSLGG